MLDEAIEYMKKELKKHETMKDNLLKNTRTNIVNKAVARYSKLISLLRFILRTLEEQRRKENDL